MIHVFVDELTESNCYVLEEEGHAIIIDPNQSADLLSWLREKKAIDYLLLTHEHCDHMSGVKEVRGYSKAPLICSKACNIGIQDTHKNMSSIMEVYLHFRGKDKIKYEPFVCEQAQITFEEEYNLLWQKYKITMKRVPGHTIGSSVIYVQKENENPILFSGDYLIHEQKVITRLQSGNAKAYEEEGKPYLENLPAHLHLYPGHGIDYCLDQEGMWKNGL